MINRPITRKIMNHRFRMRHVPVILRLPLFMEILLFTRTGRPLWFHRIVGEGFPEALHCSSALLLTVTVTFCGVSVMIGGGLLSALSSKNKLSWSTTSSTPTTISICTSHTPTISIRSLIGLHLLYMHYVS